MSDIEIVHPVGVEAAPGWAATKAITFFGDPQGGEFRDDLANEVRLWDAARTWGAHADGAWVATLATMPRTITVPGPDGDGAGELAVDALTEVTVAATHRRHGLLTRMLTESLRAARRRGDAISILIAAEWPIYGRFGYAPATRGASYRYFPRQAATRLTASGNGAVRRVEAAEAGPVGNRVYRAAGAARSGQVERPDHWWSIRHGLDGFVRPGRGSGEKTPTCVLREGADGPDGLISWRPVHDFDLAGNLATIEVTDLLAATDDAYRDLWAYLSGIDAVGEVILRNRPVDEPIRWLLPDGRALRQSFAGDDVWLRLLDVPAALAARTYAVPGELVVEVGDDPSGYANGRWRLAGGPDGASCDPTSAPADLTLSHRALASAYLGGYRLAEIAAGGGVTQFSHGALARADAMFATGLAPWNPTGF